jgi:hypothetical protein
MNSLGQNDADKQAHEIRVSNPQPQNESRLVEYVIEAVRRLERESDKLSQLSADHCNPVGFRLAEPLETENRESGEETARRVWTTLNPEFVTQERMATAAGFVGAMAVSAIVALIVVKVIYPPSTSTGTEERVAESTSLSDLAKVSEAQAKMEPADEPAPAATWRADAPPSQETAAAKPPAPMQSAKAEPGPQEMTTTDQSYTKISQPSTEGLFKQFQAWAAEKDKRATVGPTWSGFKRRPGMSSQ